MGTGKQDKERVSKRQPRPAGVDTGEHRTQLSRWACGETAAHSGEREKDLGEQEGL